MMNSKQFQWVRWIAAILLTTCIGCAVPTNGTDEADGMPSEREIIMAMQEGPEGWSANGVLHALAYSEVVSCQAQFKSSGDYTVQFNFQAAQGIQAEAIITWSVAGNNVIRRVSLSNGQSVSGTGQAVKIKIFDVSDPSFAPPPGDARTYNMSVQIAKGTRADTQQPPILIPHPYTVSIGSPPEPFEQGVYIVPPAGTTNIPIPPDSGIISILVLASPSGEPAVGYQAQGTAPVIPNDMIRVSVQPGAGEFVPFDPRQFPGWIPVPPGARDVSLQNLMPGGGANPSVIFSVFYGIDG